MSEHLHPGIHPDADSLSAFVEGVLPEHERLACLAHLADCTRCREVVYLAQEPASVPVAKEPVRMWKRWFAPIPALSAAAAVCALVVSMVVYRQYNKPVAAVPELTASNSVPAVAPPAPEMLKQAPAPEPPAKALVKREPIPAAAAPRPDVSAAAPPPLPLPSPAPAAAPLAAEATNAFAPAITNNSSPSELAAVAGTVTDPSGAVVAGASVTVRPVAGTSSSNARTDAKGQFNLAGLEPGRYELQFNSPGFKQTSKQIDLQPQEIAKVDSLLEIGAATESVTVTAAAPVLNTETSSIAVSKAKKTRVSEGGVSELPSKLPPATTAAKGKVTLAADVDGALFLSANAGKSWKAVKPVWRGKVARLAAPPAVPGAANALFQLTTDSASVWLSRNGNRWYPAPAQR
jgi:hypothetical protein